CATSHARADIRSVVDSWRSLESVAARRLDRVPGSWRTRPTDAAVPDGTTVERSPGSALESRLPARAAWQPSDLFSDDLLQDLLVERQIGHDRLQSRVLVLEHLEAPQLGYAEVCVLLLPRVVRGLRHADLPAHVDDRRSRFAQPQRVRNLLLAEPRLLHRFSLRPSRDCREATLPLVLN